jgi:sodium/potassium-transporting ATPase subunit alpha
VTRCRQAGVRVIMVTGDHPHTALALAREVDVVRMPAPTVLTGEAVRQMSAAGLQLALDAPEILFARVTAEQKMIIVQALQQKGEIVAVTGDGVNDAPALKTADIGIAMGLSGTDVAREAADIVLLDDHFATIVNAIEEDHSALAVAIGNSGPRRRRSVTSTVSSAWKTGTAGKNPTAPAMAMSP